MFSKKKIEQTVGLVRREKYPLITIVIEEKDDELLPIWYVRENTNKLSDKKQLL